MKIILGLILIVASAALVGTQSSSNSNNKDEYNIPKDFSFVKKYVGDLAKDHIPQEIVDYIHKYTKDDLSVYAYIALFMKLEKEKKLNRPALVHLAIYLKEVMDGLDKTSGVYDSANKLKANLPESVRNLAFADCMLIRRKAKKENMFAVYDKYKLDDKRRRVFTWIPAAKKSSNNLGCWTVEVSKNDSNTLMIKNDHFKEYVYPAINQYKIDKSRRGVYTWIPGDCGGQCNWIIEPNGKYVYIKNKQFGEYLTTDNDKVYDKERRYVYTAMSKRKSEGSLWEIVNEAKSN